MTFDIDYNASFLSAESSIIPAILGLGVAGIWLMYKLGLFQMYIKFNEPKGILLPSLFALISPFLFMYLFQVSPAFSKALMALR